MGSAQGLIFVSYLRQEREHCTTTLENGDRGKGKTNQSRLMRILSRNGHAFIGTTPVIIVSHSGQQEAVTRTEIKP
uniref:Uncharacterized protein n=1 Tax=Zea mays TaxID=4577 RepID=B6UEV2_MAIZE|nr:hypothetical protein [Zea mays]